MTIPMSTIIKSAGTQTLGALAGVLKKGADHAAAHKLPEEVFLTFRLYPDTSDNLCRGAARLSGMDLPSFPDVETSFAQLIERTQKANAFVQAASSEAMDRRAETIVNIPLGGGKEMPMTCAQYLLGWVLPNFYFHAATSYDILRHNGVVLGKGDFLRPPA
jgi:uncharacterized protein